MIDLTGKEIDTSKMKPNERFTEDLGRSMSGITGTVAYRNTQENPIYKGVRGIHTIYYYQFDIDNGDLEFDKMVFGGNLKVKKINWK